MKTLNLLVLISIIGLFVSSCKKDDTVVYTPTEAILVSNLYAPADVRDHMTGEIIQENEFVYFDFSAGKIVAKTESWDIAFKGTVLITNGGFNGSGNVSATVVATTFSELKEVSESQKFVQDTELLNAIPAGSDNGWYNYNPANHLISPIAGRIILVKTTEGNYAKMEILNYYKDAPSNPDPAVDPQDYYSFNYAYQKDGSKKF